MNQLEQLSALAREKNCRVLENEPMSRHTTFQIGGPADRLIVVNDEEALAALLGMCARLEIPSFVLGNGSNLLVRDEGIRGVVIKLGEGFCAVERTGPYELTCGAAAHLKNVCLCAQERGLAGLEFAYGIPGSTGGAAYMNAGAYGGEMKDVVVRCRHVTRTGERSAYKTDQLDFSYRHSAYSGGDSAITAVVFQLAPGNPSEIKARMDDLMARRVDKQPLDYPSAGSVFKRPPGNFAGTLIDSCGLKGRRVGGAMVSEKHAGFIVNAGGATCRDVLSLIEIIRDTVQKQTGVLLECEMKTIG